MHIHAHTRHPHLEMTISLKPASHLTGAKEQIYQPSVSDILCWFVAHGAHLPWCGGIAKIVQGGHFGSTRTPKICVWFQHARVRLALCGWQDEWPNFEPAWTFLDDSTAVARWTKTQNCWREASLMRPQAINKYLIYANAIVSGTMVVGGQMFKVLACPEYPCRFYGRGKTGPNTDSSRKIEKSSRGWGLGWGQKVVGHMPWGALSWSPRVRGH